jgi:hypothetical protein
MKVLKSKIIKGLSKPIIKANRYGRKNPKKSLAIAGSIFLGTNLGLGAYGYKKYKEKKNG